MAMPQTITAGRHVYADGQFKRMLINGEWVKSASGKTFESRNPATGDLLATVAEGDKEDIDRAVAAARAAFEGPWSKFKPYGLAGGGANPFAIDQHALDFAIGIGMPNGFDRLWHCHCLLLHFPIYIIKYNDEHGPSR